MRHRWNLIYPFPHFLHSKQTAELVLFFLYLYLSHLVSSHLIGWYGSEMVHVLCTRLLIGCDVKSHVSTVLFTRYTRWIYTMFNVWWRILRSISKCFYSHSFTLFPSKRPVYCMTHAYAKINIITLLLRSL